MQGSSRQGVQRALAQHQYVTTSKNHCRRAVGVFMGSGSDGMSDPRVADTILDLVKSSSSSSSSSLSNVPNDPIHVAYLGTATYDIPIFCTQQTQRFVERGCIVTPINVATTITTSTRMNNNNNTIPSSKDDITVALDRAHVILVSGGNTLYAIDRWRHMGYVIPLLVQAMDRGAVLTGGSAGAICWFDGGHSDSMDPDTYQLPMVEQFGVVGTTTTTTKTTTDTTTILTAETVGCGGSRSGSATGGSVVVVTDESSTLGETVKDWKYIRVDGLGFLPGLICPHHDRIQSNGVLRATDFDLMLLQHSGEVGIGIDHWAALVVEGDDYRVLSLHGKMGSVRTNPDTGKEEFSVESGIPGIWIKTVVTVDNQTVVASRVCPPQGKLSDILRVASAIVRDTEAIDICRRANPSCG
jgi:dipeptidase E